MASPAKKSFNTKAIVFVLLFFGVLTFSTLYQPEPLEEVAESLRERYQAAERIPDEVKYRIKRNWSGKGQVLVARVIEPVHTEVSRRATIEDDGSFATAVYSGRSLEFYAHGYDPLIIEAKEHIAGSVYDAGENHFEKAPPQRIRQLKGTIRLESTDTQLPEVALLLNIPNDTTVSRDHGHWQHRTEPTAESQTHHNGDPFSFEGLSAIPYELVIKAQGHIEQRIEIKPHLRGIIDLGDVSVIRAKTLRFRYVSQINMEKLGDWPEAQEVDILCNGRTQFLFTEHRDKHRNLMRLRLTPTENKVEAHFGWIPAEYYDLGLGNLEDFISGKRKIELSKTVSDRRLPLQEGHIYFFRHKGKEVSCLFSIEEL